MKPYEPRRSGPAGLALAADQSMARQTGIEPAAIPSRLVLPIHQHAGDPGEPVVEVGERVLRGQIVADGQGETALPVHASTSGRVTAVGRHPVTHPSGLSDTCVVIEPDGRDEAMPGGSAEDPEALSPAALQERVRAAGLAGLGGAAFPTWRKLVAGLDEGVDRLIVNGAECEPGISCDEALMRERPAETVAAARLLQRSLNASECLIAVEDRLSDIRDDLASEIDAQGAIGCAAVAVPSYYPVGGERQLIYALTGEEVPSGGLPPDIGMLCVNVATAAAARRAAVHGEPLTERVVTVTGAGVQRPGNFRVRLGTPIAELIAHCGGYTDAARRLIVGGPMMGFALPDDDRPVVKGSDCILIAGPEVDPGEDAPMPCIRCGECMEVCPAGLLPQQIYWHARHGDLAGAEGYDLFDCIECGCCAAVCPSHLPLVAHYRRAKAEIWSRERERVEAEQAKRRYELRRARLERRAAEQERARRAKREAVAAARPGEPAGDRRSAIEAARARTKARRKGDRDSE